MTLSLIKKEIHRSSFFCRAIFLGIQIFFNSLYAQDKKATDDKVEIVFVAQGTKIYSADQSFNNQIDQGKVIVENGDLSFEENDDSHRVLIVSTPNSKIPSFSRQVKSSEEKKKKELLKKIKNEIDHYEAQKESFEKKDYHSFPSPFQFFSSHSTSQNCIAPCNTSHDFSKIYTDPKKYSIHHDLDNLHTQKYSFYNNKSLDFCFSDVFSIRPPPVLVL
ncbi:hypothetical protein [Chryseobacterium sp. IT-36CA2]|uniref:hypothetical protein n=1 Tax=Chryseobacterium sp. IT-36CA2 TaxID=3026460 RepID=UPI0039DF2B90